MKMQGPANTGGLSIAGNSYEPDQQGCIEVPTELVAQAMSHGFSPFNEASESTNSEAMVNFSKLTKKQLIAFAKENLETDLDETKTNKELIEAIEALMEAKA